MLQTAAACDGQRDQDIVELLGGGQYAAAFERVMERYEQKVYRLCCSILRHADQAEDAAQESLVRVWRALPKYDARASLSTWIYTITRNRCLTAIKRRRELASLSDAGIALEADSAAAAAAEDGEEPQRRPGGTGRSTARALPPGADLCFTIRSARWQKWQSCSGNLKGPSRPICTGPVPCCSSGCARWGWPIRKPGCRRHHA